MNQLERREFGKALLAAGGLGAVGGGALAANAVPAKPKCEVDVIPHDPFVGDTFWPVHTDMRCRIKRAINRNLQVGDLFYCCAFDGSFESDTVCSVDATRRGFGVVDNPLRNDVHKALDPLYTPERGIQGEDGNGPSAALAELKPYYTLVKVLRVAPLNPETKPNSRFYFYRRDLQAAELDVLYVSIPEAKNRFYPADGGRHWLYQPDHIDLYTDMGEGTLVFRSGLAHPSHMLGMREILFTWDSASQSQQPLHAPIIKPKQTFFPIHIYVGKESEYNNVLSGGLAPRVTDCGDRSLALPLIRPLARIEHRITLNKDGSDAVVVSDGNHNSRRSG